MLPQGVIPRHTEQRVAASVGGWGRYRRWLKKAVIVVVDKVGMAKVDVGLVVEGEGQGWKTAELLQSGT